MTRAIARERRRIPAAAVGRIMSVTAPIAFAVVFLLAIAAIQCTAQEALTPATLARGMKVRLEWSPPESGPRRGTVGPEPDSNGFLFRPSNRDAARRVSYAALESLEVRTSRDSRWMEGMLIGLGAGALFPYILEPEAKGDLDLRLLASMILGPLAGLVGAGVGYAIATETWAPIPLR